MPEIVGVRFRDQGKVYYFDPDEHILSYGSEVIVETSRGIEFGEVVIENSFIPEEECKQPLKKVVRVATDQDRNQVKENRRSENGSYSGGVYL